MTATPSLSSSAQTTTAKTDSKLQPLPHEIDGEGPPLVLLNGGMMTIAAWEPIAARLRERHTVLRFDFRGQALAPVALGDEPRTLDEHVDDVEALLDAVGWDTAHFVGVSFGAEVALALLARAPERFRSLVVITAMDRETEEFRRQRQQMDEIVGEILDGASRDRFFETFIERVYSEPYLEAEAETFAARRGQFDRLPPTWFLGVAHLLAALENFDVAPKRPPECPTLAILAADDRVMAEERALALARALDAEVVTHPTAGHGLVAEDSDFVAEHCLRFLARL